MSRDPKQIHPRPQPHQVVDVMRQGDTPGKILLRCRDEDVVASELASAHGDADKIRHLEEKMAWDAEWEFTEEEAAYLYRELRGIFRRAGQDPEAM